MIPQRACEHRHIRGRIEVPLNKVRVTAPYAAIASWWRARGRTRRWRRGRHTRRWRGRRRVGRHRWQRWWARRSGRRGRRSGKYLASSDLNTEVGTEDTPCRLQFVPVNCFPAAPWVEERCSSTDDVICERVLAEIFEAIGRLAATVRTGQTGFTEGLVKLANTSAATRFALSLAQIILTVVNSQFRGSPRARFLQSMPWWRWGRTLRWRWR